MTPEVGMNRKLFSIVIRVGAVALILSPGPVWSQTEAGKPRFERDILPILSRYGCNSSGCHGKAEGQKRNGAEQFFHVGRLQEFDLEISRIRPP